VVKKFFATEPDDAVIVAEIVEELDLDDDLAVGDTFSERESQRMIVVLSFVRLIQSTLKQQV
jgi:hypothetical protein